MILKVVWNWCSQEVLTMYHFTRVWSIIFIILLNPLFHETLLLDGVFIEKVLGHFNVINPNISVRLKDSSGITIMKLFSRNSQFVKIQNNASEQLQTQSGACSNIVYIVNDQPMYIVSNIDCPMLVLVSNDRQMEQVISEVQVAINQEVYFMNMESLEVFETYTINKQHIVRQLGKFTNNFQYSE